MSNETELLPCPFCGGEGEEKHRHNFNAVACTTCHAATPQSSLGYGDAGKLWNRRAADRELRAEGSNLRAVIDAAASKLDAAMRCHPNEIETLVSEALEILDGDRPPQQIAEPQGWRELAQRCLSSMRDAVNFRETGRGRPPEQTCMDEIAELEAMLAAAPKLQQIAEPASDDALMAREMYESQEDSLLICASDLQHSAIYDNHVEMQSCSRAVADRISALAAAPAQPAPVDADVQTLIDSAPTPEPGQAVPSDHDALRCAVGNCKFNGEVDRHAQNCTAIVCAAVASPDPATPQFLVSDLLRAALRETEACLEMGDVFPGLLKVVKRALAAPQPPAKVKDAWQTIETAPKDGTEILLRSAKGRIADGLWSAASERSGFWAWAYVNQEPAEWMPLPLAQAKEDAQDDKAFVERGMRRIRDAEDAQRYRLMKRGQHWSVIDGAGNTLRAEVLDAAVDAAIAAQQGGGT